MARRFSDDLRQEADPLWQQILSHPFLRELGEGRLPLDVFRFYVKQDYVYLLEFSRCLGIAAAKAEDRETMRTFASLLEASLTIEVTMLEQLGDQIGITMKELQTAEASPTNVAYTRHLLTVAYGGTVGEILAAMLPCMWSYQEIGAWLSTQRGVTENAVYAAWCATYQTPEYRELVAWYRRLVDNLAAASGSLMKERMRAHFLLSSRYEYLFWEMAYRQETWPL